MYYCTLVAERHTPSSQPRAFDLDYDDSSSICSDETHEKGFSPSLVEQLAVIRQLLPDLNHRREQEFTIVSVARGEGNL